jgi:hypothetical protein
MYVFQNAVTRIYSLTCSIFLVSPAEGGTGLVSEDCDNHRDHTSLPSRDPMQPEPSNNYPHPSKNAEDQTIDTIHRLMQHPALYEPMRRPRYPIVLCHGMKTRCQFQVYHAPDSFIMHRTIWIRCSRPCLFSKFTHAVLVERLEYFTEESGCGGNCYSCTGVCFIATSFWFFYLYLMHICYC